MTTAANSGTAPKKFAFDARYAAPILITVILVIGDLFYGILESRSKTALSIITAILSEVALGLLVTRKIPNLASAYVSGISCGILVRSADYWPYAMVAAISILSKYVLRWQGRHLWNPSNFGVATLFFLAPQSAASLSIQWGNSWHAMAVIWLIGSITVWRLKRLHICAIYVASFFLFAGLRSLIPGHTFAAEASPITGPMYQLFVFFMITDPKTTVRSRNGQMIVAFCVAAVENVIRLIGDVHAPYYALFLVGPVANVIDNALTQRRLRLSRSATGVLAAA